MLRIPTFWGKNMRRIRDMLRHRTNLTPIWRRFWHLKITIELGSGDKSANLGPDWSISAHCKVERRLLQAVTVLAYRLCAQVWSNSNN